MCLKTDFIETLKIGMNVKQASEKHNERRQNGILLNMRQEERRIYFHLLILFHLLATSDGLHPPPACPLQFAARVSGFRGYWSCADGKLQQEAGRTSQSGVHHHPSSRSSLLLTSLAANPDPDSLLSTALHNKRSTKTTFWFYLQPQGLKKKKKRKIEAKTVTFYLHFPPPNLLSRLNYLNARQTQSQDIKVHLFTHWQRPSAFAPGPSQFCGPSDEKKKIKRAPSPFSCVALFLVFRQDASLQEVELIRRQGFSQGTEEAEVVCRVVDHEEDASQQLIGHQQVVKVRPLVVLAAVAATPLHQGSKVVSVP